MSIYKNHMFFCTHTREDGECCGAANTADMIHYAKEKAKSLGLTKATQFRISSSGCMGRCKGGPFLVVYPKGEWFSYSTQEDIDHILESILATYEVGAPL